MARSEVLHELQARQERRTAEMTLICILKRESRGRRSLRDSRFRARFYDKATARAVRRPGPMLRLWLGPGPLQPWPVSAARNRQPAARRSRFRAGRPRTTRKSREKRPPREITGPNRRFLDGHHGNYSARTCSSSPRPEKIKHRAALARRRSKRGSTGASEIPFNSSKDSESSIVSI